MLYEIQMQIHLPVHVRNRLHGRRQGQELVKIFISYMYICVDAHIVVSVSVETLLHFAYRHFLDV